MHLIPSSDQCRLRCYHHLIRCGRRTSPLIHHSYIHVSDYILFYRMLFSCPSLCSRRCHVLGEKDCSSSRGEFCEKSLSSDLQYLSTSSVIPTHNFFLILVFSVLQLLSMPRMSPVVFSFVGCEVPQLLIGIIFPIQENNCCSAFHKMQDLCSLYISEQVAVTNVPRHIFCWTCSLFLYVLHIWPHAAEAYVSIGVKRSFSAGIIICNYHIR